ncbi:MAG TPA: NAD(P)-binding domain-containing protein [Candidatus Limnocylindrales bacterium]|nr:NAD(P)-binding domain-containing protein [Candidatus Limnocylindrales bacterium]
MTRSVDTAIVGAGQAGLIVSGLLAQAGVEHVLLERRETLGGGWQDRWDAFQLVSPNWTTTVEGFPYRGSELDGFMAKDELIAHWRDYAAAISAPVELGTDVTRLEPLGDSRAARFRVTTNRGRLDARHVVVAGGPFQVPHVPSFAAAIDPSIAQVHVHDYRRPEALPPGDVLIVGSGQSGVQLAEELVAADRSVTMATGRCGRAPRRYRDRDVFWWLREVATRGAAFGVGLPSPATLPDARARFACNPHLSGHDGGHDTNLRAMARDGMRVVGRVADAAGTRVRLAPDLASNLAFADSAFENRLQPIFDRYATLAGLDLPNDELAQVAYEPPEVLELDLAAEGISTILWTSGYRPRFDWIELPALDDVGLPIQDGGRTPVPGLSFIGTPYLVDMGSANLVGLERDARALVEAWAG